jgi:Tol biopolymer transport system component
LPETTINPVGAAYCKPAWSPVGDRIAFCFFSEDAPNTSGIYVIDRDGQNMKPLITPVTEIRGLDWSSDGKQLLYTKDAGDGGEDIWVCMANVDGSQEKLIKKVHHLMGVTLSPDSSKIAYIVQEGLRGGDLYIMNSDGSNINNLTKTEDQESESSPSWSPDGKRLVYIGNACDSVGCYDSLYVINADGTDKKLITRGYFYFENVSWSPDGEWLLLVARKSNPQGTGSDDVLIKWKVDF